jgi:hypothetical protein
MNDNAPGGKHLAVAESQHNTATGSHYDIITLSQLVDNFLLPISETYFTLDIEYPSEVCARSLFDHMIGVVKLPVHGFREQASDSALANCHQADEKNILFCHENGAILAPLVYQSKKANW